MLSFGIYRLSPVFWFEISRSHRTGSADPSPTRRFPRALGPSARSARLSRSLTRADGLSPRERCFSLVQRSSGVSKSVGTSWPSAVFRRWPQLRLQPPCRIPVESSTPPSVKDHAHSRIINYSRSVGAFKHHWCSVWSVALGNASKTGMPSQSDGIATPSAAKAVAAVS
jgi:hypothetical protein